MIQRTSRGRIKEGGRLTLAKVEEVWARFADPNYYTSKSEVKSLIPSSLDHASGRFSKTRSSKGLPDE